MSDLIEKLEGATEGSRERLVCRDDFICAICGYRVTMRWNRRGPDEIMPPVCRSCEVVYARGQGKPSAGTKRDRRIVLQGLALAEALRCEAARKTWSVRYG